MTSSPTVELIETKLLSDNWYVLQKVTYRIRKNNGAWEQQSREVYDRGNGATILLYDRLRGTVILTRQFRMPTFVNGNASGMLIETCAGLLDQDNPEQCISREAREETGYEIRNARKVFEAYMSPGSVTEILHFFVAEYTQSQRLGAGGGVEEEEIEVLEMTFDDALAKIASGEIKDGKTIMLLQYARLHLFN
jgi:GDP-mannose pyrophosphatase NudK